MTVENDKFKRQWWVNPIDPGHMLELSEKDRKNGKSFNHWLLLWGIAFFGVVLSFEPHAGGISDTPFWRLILVFSPLFLSIFLIRSFIRLFTNISDDLLRRIYYQALAGGFMSAFVISMCFSLAAVIFGPSTKAGPVIFVGLIAGYFISLYLSYRKYNV